MINFSIDSNALRQFIAENCWTEETPGVWEYMYHIGLRERARRRSLRVKLEVLWRLWQRWANERRIYAGENQRELLKALRALGYVTGSKSYATWVQGLEPGIPEAPIKQMEFEAWLKANPQ